MCPTGPRRVGGSSWEKPPRAFLERAGTSWGRRGHWGSVFLMAFPVQTGMGYGVPRPKEAEFGACRGGGLCEHLLCGCRGGLVAGRTGASHLRPSATRPEPARARSQGSRGAVRKGGGPKAGDAAVREVERSPEALAGSARRCRRTSDHEDPVDGAVRSGAAVARGPGWLRRGRPLLSWPGPGLLRSRLEAGQGLWNMLL